MSDDSSRAATRSRRLAILAGGYAAAFVALYLAAVCTSLGQMVDASSLGVLGWLRSDAWLAFYGGRDIVLYGVLGAGAVAGIAAILRRSWRPAIYAAALVGIVAVASVVLKDVLPRPYFGDFAYLENTFPSGHAAITLAASIAIIWCNPPWMSRILVLVLGALVAFVALGSVLSFAHRASDSVGGILLTGAVSCALAALARVAAPAASRLRTGSMVGALVALGVAFLFLLATLGAFGGGDRAAPLGFAIVLGTLGATASILAVHRPFDAPRSVSPPVGEAASQDERL